MYADTYNTMNVRIRNASGFTVTTAPTINWNLLNVYTINAWWNPAAMHVRVTGDGVTHSDDDLNDFPSSATMSGTLSFGAYGGYFAHGWIGGLYTCPGPVGCREQVSKWGNPAYGPNIFNDGEFARWIAPDGWEVLARGAAYSPTRTIYSHAGSYAARFNGEATSGDLSVLLQEIAGMTPSDEYESTFYAKGSPCSLELTYVYDDEFSVYAWNFTGPNQGTWTTCSSCEMDILPPPGDQAYSFSVGAAYGQYTSPLPRVIVPLPGFMAVVLHTDNTCYLDDVTFEKDGVGPNLILNPGFEAWSVSDRAEFWQLYFDSPTLCDREDVVKFSGDYAVKLVGAAGDHCSVFQQKVGLTVGSPYRVTFWSRNDASGGRIGMFIINNPVLEQTQYWNWVTGSWDTVPEGALPVWEQVKFWTLTSAYNQYETTVFTVPASGKLGVVFLSDGDAKPVYLDDAYLQRVE